MYFNSCEQLLENNLLNILGNNFFNIFEDNLFNYSFIPNSCNNNNNYLPFMNIYEYSLGKEFSSLFNQNFNPNMNMSEDEKKFYINIELPGMTKEEIKIEYNEEEHKLVVSGERKPSFYFDQNENDESIEKASSSEQNKNNGNCENKENKDKENKENNENNENKKRKYSIKESKYGKFSKSISIPENGNIDSIQAKTMNGLLEITIEKIEPSKNETRSIQIQ